MFRNNRIYKTLHGLLDLPRFTENKRVIDSTLKGSFTPHNTIYSLP